ncbi:MAG: helix-turn-helix transcriptional regulator [Halobacteriales archaeon]
MARPSAVALAVCLLAVAAGAAGATPAATGIGLDLGQEFDRTQFRIAVYPNGSARWTFHYERTLDNASEREQFEAFAAGFTANETGLFGDFRNQSRALAAQGEAATGREMAARAFARRAFVTTTLNDVGVVEMAFTWTGFARVEGERVIVGDVFEGGLYIGPGQSLVIRPAGGLVFRSVEPRGTLSGSSLAASDTVTWQGERSFTDNHPRVVFGPAAAGSPTTTGPGTTQPPAGGTDRTTTAATEPSSTWPVALVVLVIVAALGMFLYRRRGTGSAGRPPAGPADGPDGAASVDSAALLEDEERVVQVLREHGGRMRQSAIVEATGWSKSKVSMVLSEMAEADQVRKLQVGRENLISLPGHEPDAARSSLEASEEDGDA